MSSLLASSDDGGCWAGAHAACQKRRLIWSLSFVRNKCSPLDVMTSEGSNGNVVSRGTYTSELQFQIICSRLHYVHSSPVSHLPHPTPPNQTIQPLI